MRIHLSCGLGVEILLESGEHLADLLWFAKVCDGIRNVIVGALLIGVMLNAMTIIDIPNIYQNLIKSTILLIAIVVDSLINPRDEQTAQQGDI